MKKGLFITFEGGDGSGKSTQISILRDRLSEAGCDVLLTREPGGTKISEKIRSVILDKENSEMEAVTEALLYAAARAQLVAEVIEPAIRKGIVVICDRFVDSSIAYQAYGRDLGEAVEVINSYAIGECMPDITILLKLDPYVGRRRINARDGDRDRIELASEHFHDKVYGGYLELEKKHPQRIIGIEADRTIEETAELIWEKISPMLGE